jgi:MFS family permease
MTETKSPRNKLFLMMVMEFFIWGAWLPLIYGYLPSLGFTPVQQAWILNAFPIAAIVGMFFSNQFADRHFAAERFLGFSHLLGGLAILGLGFTRGFWPFLILMWIHCLFYVPTNSIANSIAFAHMKDSQKEFGLVRMGGTLGWILAAWPFTFIFVDWARVKAAAPRGLVAWIGTALGSGLTGQALKQATRWTFIVAGIVSLALAAYSLLLPHTPPKKKVPGTSSTTERFAWLETLRLLKRPFVLVLWLIAFIDAFVHNLYFNWTGTFLGTSPAAGGVGIPGNWIMPVMSLGQVSELLTMLILGMVLKKLGWRFTMLIGILGHAARFAVYAFFPSHPWMIVAIQVLHGICYAFFFATVYIFVDTYFPKDVRSSAQGLFNVMILGLGVLAANTLGPWLIQSVFTAAGVTDFKSLFLLPCLTALGAAILLAVAFRPPAVPRTEEGRI